MKQNLFFQLIILLICLFFFSPMIISGKLPIPSDTIIGLYHPFRDLYAENYPNGIPYKNFLITDPVRQQYPWRLLSMDLLKRGEVPLWNPYSQAGTPLLANVQSAVFNPFNLLLFILPFVWGWSIQVMLQPLLLAVFLYLYLRNLKLEPVAALASGISLAFCGFSVAWMEWNTVLHTGLWLPMILLAVDKLTSTENNIRKSFFTDSKLLWGIVLICSLSFSVFAGHLQTFFYVFVFSSFYLLIRMIQRKASWHLILGLVLSYIMFFTVTAVQILSSFNYILLSARDVDLQWQTLGWFLPWLHILQLFVPDFFGNPTTLNYWGVWNYAEFSSYIGVIPLLLAVYAILWRRDKKTYLFTLSFLISLFFILPTPLAELPFLWNVPMLSSAQPTRLLFVVDFSLVILAGLGLDLLLKQRKNTLLPIAMLLAVYGVIWVVVMFFGDTVLQTLPENIATTKRNLYLPSIVLIAGSILLLLIQKIQMQKLRYVFISLIVLLILFDFYRFFTKFTPFTEQEYLYPQTKTIDFLQKQLGNFRIMETDSRILPPNFSSIYRIQSIDGYDPLYLRRYGELIAASERGKPDINPPFGFNRIITPQNYSSKIIDLLGVKYVLSMNEIDSPKMKKVFEEGQTKVYENSEALPRAFFVKRTTHAHNKQEAINKLMDPNFDPQEEAVVEYNKLPGSFDLEKGWTVGEARITRYTENLITIQTYIPTDDPDAEGYLVLMDSFYPTWRAVFSRNDIVLETENIIFLTNYNFRGVVVPAGEHTITFSNAVLHKLELL